MKMFYTRLTKGKDKIELMGEATMENMTAADTARQLLADGWAFVPQAELAADVRTASIPEPGYRPAVH